MARQKVESLEEIKERQMKNYRKNYYKENKKKISDYQKKYYLQKKGLPEDHVLKWRGEVKPFSVVRGVKITHSWD